MKTPVAQLLATIMLGFFLAGCTTLDDCVTPVGNRELTPGASQNGAHAGEVVTWGGRLIAIENDADETRLEVASYPIDRCGHPSLRSSSEGRFLVSKRGFLDPLDYRPGRLVAVTGRIAGAPPQRGVHSSGSLPVLTDSVIQLWPDSIQANTSEGGGWRRPVFSVGIGGGSGHVGGGIGVSF